MKDPWFRRHILVQFLILFQSLRVISEGSKDSPDARLYTAEQVSIPLCYISLCLPFFFPQKATVAILTNGTKNILLKTPPMGNAFTTSVYSILKRENNWVRSSQHYRILTFTLPIL